jgi:RNA polymerase sigma-70 factor (ECF subfamily)
MNEKRLLAAIAKLDQDALALVFEQYAPLVYKYVLRMCHDPQEADDVVGDVFSRLLSRLVEGKGPRENLRSYLYQTAYHIIVDHARDRKHYAPLDDLLNRAREENLPPEVAEEHRKLLLLQNAINTTLTEDQKHVIVLRFLEGFDVRETAGILGKEISNVKVIQNRAVAKLREALGNEIEEMQ